MTNHHPDKCRVIHMEMKNLNIRYQVSIVFCRDDNPNVEPYLVKKYTNIITEVLDTDIFQ